jgi:arsenite-transporting ATPase
VITRFIEWFHDFNIPVGGVIVNMVIDKSSVLDHSPDFVKNRVAMQDAYMIKIDQEFGNRVRAVLPLLETEVRGVDMIKRMVGLLYT